MIPILTYVQLDIKCGIITHQRQAVFLYRATLSVVFAVMQPVSVCHVIQTAKDIVSDASLRVPVVAPVIYFFSGCSKSTMV